MEKNIGNTSEIPEEERVEIIRKSNATIARAVVMSIIITLISFAPILFLTGQEQKLFTPLVLTKTFCMVGSIIVALFILPVALRTFLKGKIRSEDANPISKYLSRFFTPIIKFCLSWKKSVLLVLLILVGLSIPVIIKTGTEFMPPWMKDLFYLCPLLCPVLLIPK